MRRILPVLILALVAACGDDGAAGPDGGTGGADGGPGADARPGGLYDDPFDFDRDACSDATPLDTIDLAGIWHLDLTFADFGSFPSTVRIDGAAGSYTARLFGREADQILVDSADVFIRRAWETMQGERVQALTACAVRDDGGLEGAYASCTDGECFLGTFVAYLVEPLDEPVASGMSLLANYRGPAGDPWPLEGDITVNVRVRDGLAYVVRYGDGLRIVDLGDLQAIDDRGHSPVMYEDYEIYNDVKLADGPEGQLYAIVASNLRGAVVVDVTDPDAPVEVAQFPPPPPGEQTVNVHTLFIDGGRAYLANITTGGVDIFDLADPAAPQRLGDWVHPMINVQGGFVHDLFVRDGQVFLNYWNLGMVILDSLADPADPTLVGVFDSYERRTSHSTWVTDVAGRSIAVHGDEDFGAHVRIVDIDPASVDFLDTLGEYQTRQEVSVHNILAHGNLAFVSYYQDGLRVLDLADPADPVEIAHYQTWPGAEPGYGDGFYEGAIGVDYDATNGHIYVADTHSGLWVMTLDP